MRMMERFTVHMRWRFWKTLNCETLHQSKYSRPGTDSPCTVSSWIIEGQCEKKKSESETQGFAEPTALEMAPKILFGFMKDGFRRFFCLILPTIYRNRSGKLPRPKDGCVCRFHGESASISNLWHEFSVFPCHNRRKRC